ncbi:protein of unknown function [Methylorubrum extorquens]|uniref:Uncharacterized protein n=1 Tax=Methylorubrum extorquens TaxID=408 RepID=A0A2N9AIK5_METEX|nr:protein of unknown function [Methylorubrum extorquens]
MLLGAARRDAGRGAADARHPPQPGRIAHHRAAGHARGQQLGRSVDRPGGAAGGAALRTLQDSGPVRAVLQRLEGHQRRVRVLARVIRRLDPPIHRVIGLSVSHSPNDLDLSHAWNSLHPAHPPAGAHGRARRPRPGAARRESGAGAASTPHRQRRLPADADRRRRLRR